MPSEYRGVEVFGRAATRRAEPRQLRRRTRERERRSARLGVIALVAGLVTAGLTVGGVLVAMAGHFESGTLLAYLATGTSVVAALCGLVALVSGRGRALGGIGLVLGVLASPPVLTRLVDWASGLG